MSRLRTIKPGFFLDEYLADCQPLARLLFAGLWTIADREGRLEDRPRRIKAECLPYDDCDVHLLLDELAIHGFIVRYVVNGDRFIGIPTWHKHQNPHIKEAPSIIPTPVETVPSTMQEQCKHDARHNLGYDEPGRSCLVSCHGSGNLEPEKPSSRLSEPIARVEEEFELWWIASERIGSKADARELYWHWRDHGASHDDLTAAVRNDRRHCRTTQTSCRHGATFLARKPNRWREWLDEQHGDGNRRSNGKPIEPEKPICPVPGCGTRLTYDEDGAHCPMCDWRAK